MTGKMKALDSTGSGVVDVRDVALAHLRAVKVAEAANRRFLLVS